MSVSPFDIVAGPAYVYIAAQGTTFPTIGVLPAGSIPMGWSFLGRTNGGVKVSHNQTMKNLMVDQTILPQKTIRTEDMVEITFNLVNITLEHYALCINNATVTHTAAAGGVPGFKQFTFSTGVDVAQFSMTVVGPSPYMDGTLQYNVAKVSQTGKPAVDFKRDNMSELSTQWTAYEDPSNLNTFGTLLAMTEPA